MMKKIILFSLTFLASLFFGLTVMADDSGYIRDSSYLLTQSEEAQLEEQAERIAQSYDYQVYYAIVEEFDGDAESLYQEMAGQKTGVLLVVNYNTKEWAIHYGGQGRDLFQNEDDQFLWQAYARENTIGESVQSYLTTVEARFKKPALVVDRANLLTSSAESALLKKLNEISQRQKCDVVLVTVYGLNGQTPEAFADDYFDYNNYGQGENYDGILFLISMEERDWHISTSGYGIRAFTDAGIDYMSEQFLEQLSSGRYEAAFNTYADLADDFLTRAKTDKPYDVGDLPKKPLSLLWIPVSLLLGLAAAWLVTATLKGQLKSVQVASGAQEYMKKDSFKLTKSQDFFLYRNVSKQLKPKSTSSSSGFRSGGGSRTHTSSSGRSHGGRGGKF